MAEVPTKMRPARKLLRAVADLHTRGYQRLRISASIYEVGTWRCIIGPAHLFSAEHGAKLIEGAHDAGLAYYTSASGREYWDWKDSARATPARLAEEFLKRFPRLAAEGYGQDWLYAGWYQHLLHVTYPDALPTTYIPYAEPFTDCIATIGREVRIPLPPPGHANAVIGRAEPGS